MCHLSVIVCSLCNSKKRFSVLCRYIFYFLHGQALKAGDLLRHPMHKQRAVANAAFRKPFRLRREIRAVCLNHDAVHGQTFDDAAGFFCLAFVMYRIRFRNARLEERVSALKNALED